MSRWRVCRSSATSMAVQAIAIAPSEHGLIGGGFDAGGRELRLMIHRRSRCDADERMDRWHSQRDVAHVRGPGGTPKVDEGPTERLCICLVNPGQLRVVLDVGVREVAADHLERRPGRDRSGLEAPDDALPQRLQLADPFGSIMYRAEVWAGTTFGASPPFVMMPWMRSVPRMC